MKHFLSNNLKNRVRTADSLDCDLWWWGTETQERWIQQFRWRRSQL